MSLDHMAIALVRDKAATDPRFRRALEYRLNGCRGNPKPRDVLSVRSDINLETILAEVCMKHSISRSSIRNRRHWPHLVRARQEFCWRARTETKESITAIAELICRDRATVFRAADRYAEDHGHSLTRCGRTPRVTDLRMEAVL